MPTAMWIPQSRVARVLLVHSFVCSVTGFIMLIYFSYSESFELLVNLKFQSRASQRFLSSTFLFLWMACTAATIFRARIEFLALATGLLTAIVAVAFPLEDVDAIRHILAEGGLSELRILAVGEILSYCGAITGYFAIVFEPKRRMTKKKQKTLFTKKSPIRINSKDNYARAVMFLTLLIICLCISGCAVLWSSDASKYTGISKNPYREAIFSMADITIVVTTVFVANFLTGDHAYVWLASVLTGAYGFPMLYRFYNIYDQLRDDESKGFLIPKTTLQISVGTWLLFFTHVAVVTCCVLISRTPTENTQYTTIIGS